VANICYQGFRQTVAETAGGYDLANDCTYAKKANTQAVEFGNNKHVEALKQDDPVHQPIYKKGVLNGHGVVGFVALTSTATADSFWRCTSAALM